MLGSDFRSHLIASFGLHFDLLVESVAAGVEDCAALEVLLAAFDVASNFFDFF